MSEENTNKKKAEKSDIEKKDKEKNTTNNEKEKELTPEEKIIDLEDKLSRAYAEMENQRRRYEKEKDDAFEYGGFSFAREALNLLDNLDRSKISLSNDEKLKNSDSLKKITEHLDIIQKDMISIFKKNSIEPISSIDKKMDPNFHQAMMEIEDDNKEPGTIVQEIQKGFMMKDRLLRPSLVAVSKRRPETKKNDEKNKNTEKNDKN